MRMAQVAGVFGVAAAVFGGVTSAGVTAKAAGTSQAAKEPTPVPSSPEEAAKLAKAKGDTLEVDKVRFKNADGEEVKLATLLEDGPVVLVFYRGSWCPVCQGSLKKFETAASEIEAAGGRVFAITPELVEYLAPTVEKHGYERVRLLSDEGLEAGRVFGVAWKNEQYKHLSKFNGNDRLEIPLGVTYIIKPGGEIVWSYIESDYKQRADPADVVAALKAM